MGLQGEFYFLKRRSVASLLNLQFSLMSRQLHLANSSVVLLNSENTPNIFSIDFLHESGIVPRDSDIHKSIHLPQIAKVDFNDQYKFVAHGNRSMVRIDYDPTPEIDDEPLENDGVSEMAESLAQATKHMRYHALGINFQVVVPEASFSRIVDGIPQGAGAVELQYEVMREGVEVNITLKKIQKVQGEGEQNPEYGILFDSNFHNDLDKEADLAVRSEQIQQAISKREACYNQMLQLIDETSI